MRVVAVLGVLSLFISFYFMFLITSVIIKYSITCSFYGMGVCSQDGLNTAIVSGISFLVMFFVLDVFVVYYITKLMETGRFTQHQAFSGKATLPGMSQSHTTRTRSGSPRKKAAGKGA